jgi:hypothetical protein
MTTPPQNIKVVTLGSQEIKAKFEELDMMTFLSQTCHRKKLKRSTKGRPTRRFTAEHGENFIRKSDNESQAILYWWHLLTGGDDYSVEQFTGPDGIFYTTQTITHPSKLP